MDERNKLSTQAGHANTSESIALSLDLLMPWNVSSKITSFQELPYAGRLAYSRHLCHCVFLFKAFLEWLHQYGDSQLGARHCITKIPGKRFSVLRETCPRVSSSPSTSRTRCTCYNFPSTPPSWSAVSRARGEISGSLLKHQLIKRVGDNRRTREVVIGRRVCQRRPCKILY